MLVKILLVLLLLLGVLFVAGYFVSRRMSDSKKRFLRHLIKQVKYLPGRYYT
ncbi:MAG: hypothetical protein P9L99_07295 [Candidatus Lernaella stagnicola]|nr:hypothetical protein [Candidatus Lernaella stagnicola]